MSINTTMLLQLLIAPDDTYILIVQKNPESGDQAETHESDNTKTETSEATT